MYFTYIIYSQKIDKYYIGYTKDIVRRLERHNNGWSKSTKSGIPWTVKYVKEFQSKSAAIRFERKLKKQKSRDYLERIINTKNK